MGGDYAPEAAVKGAVMALDAIGSDSRIVLFGDEEKIKSVLASEGCPAERFGIVATTEVIEMGDHPAKAFQAKRIRASRSGLATWPRELSTVLRAQVRPAP